jgi:hypothetical protein
MSGKHQVLGVSGDSRHEACDTHQQEHGPYRRCSLLDRCLPRMSWHDLPFCLTVVAEVLRCERAAGLVVVEDEPVEINVFSPGGLGSCERLYGVNFAESVIQDLERKLELRRTNGEVLSNRRLATL